MLLVQLGINSILVMFGNFAKLDSPRRPKLDSPSHDYQYKLLFDLCILPKTSAFPPTQCF
jgi:hypothetical protein